MLQLYHRMVSLLQQAQSIKKLNSKLETDTRRQGYGKTSAQEEGTRAGAKGMEGGRGHECTQHPHELQTGPPKNKTPKLGRRCPRRGIPGIRRCAVPLSLRPLLLRTQCAGLPKARATNVELRDPGEPACRLGTQAQYHESSRGQTQVSWTHSCTDSERG